MADDDRYALAALASFFSTLGFEVSRASDYDDALKRAKQHEHDVLITDVHLGEPRSYNGSRLAGEMKMGAAGLATIVLTADAELEGGQIREMGADFVLEKPQPLSYIANLIQHHAPLDLHGSRAVPYGSRFEAQD